MSKPPVPLTAAGLLVVTLGVVAYFVGWQLGWEEMMVVAAGCSIATLGAVPFVIGRMQLEVVRTLDPPRVMAGDRAVAVLDVRNSGGTAVRARIIEEAVADRYVRVEVPSLGSGERHQKVYPLPTARRGLMTIGPAVIARQDPLQLMRREVGHAGQESFWVHPRYLPLRPLPVGFAKDLEGPTSETSPAGDVAFHALREYELGDDYRHIHWMSTARADKPMVRHYVDNRRPQLLVVVDDRASSLPDSQFEIAMEIVASLAVSSLMHQEPLAVWTTAGSLLGRGKSGGRDDILDRLAEATATENGDPVKAALTGIRAETGTSALVMVTGGLESADLVLLASQAKRRARVIIVRVWPAGAVETGTVPGARVIDVDDLAGFRRAWQAMTR